MGGWMRQGPRGPACCIYHRPLRWPTTTGENAERSGLLISLDGAIGEAAPLPGLHVETLDEVVARLEIPDFPADTDADDVGLLLHRINQQPFFAGLPPSLRFGIESALVIRAADRQGRSLEEFLWPDRTRHDCVPIDLFSGSIEEALHSLADGTFAGRSGVKIKVGRASMDEDLRIIHLFREALPAGEIRLDANRRFSVEQTLELGRQMNGLDIRFIEEPFAETRDLEEYLSRDPLLPLALDESLIEAVEAGQLPARHEKIRAWVIKPSCLGLLTSRELIAGADGVEAVVSSCFESEIGLRMLKARAAGTPTRPGLGTDRWFEGELRDEHLSDWIPLGEKRHE